MVMSLLAVTPVMAQNYQPGDHELLLMPTAYTMEQGQGYFSAYELVLLNAGYAVTSHTHVGAFTVFPITKDFLKTLTLGAKQQYLRSGIVSSAVWASYTPEINGLVVGNVVSIGEPWLSVHASIGAANGFEEGDEITYDDWEILYMLGARFDVASRLSLLAEYTNAESAIEEDFSGLISFGLRFRGEYTAWELGGIRPLDWEDEDELLMFPFLKATVVF
jgi:hypothetical protein